MSQNELRLTVFDVAPMRNVVGIGRATAYQINVQTGPVLAKPVRRAVFASQSAANDGPTNPSSTVGMLSSMLGRLLGR